MRKGYIEEDFWSKVKLHPTDCWVWSGRVNKSGYGYLGFEGKTQIASRIAYKLTKGYILQDLYVCHKCDNRVCVRPSHLFLGTHKENMQDRDSKGRGKLPNNAGSRNGMAILTEDKVRRIKEMLALSYPQKDIALEVGISVPTISEIKHGKKWNCVREWRQC